MRKLLFSLVLIVAISGSVAAQDVTDEAYASQGEQVINDVKALLRSLDDVEVANHRSIERLLDDVSEDLSRFAETEDGTDLSEDDLKELEGILDRLDDDIDTVEDRVDDLEDDLSDDARDRVTNDLEHIRDLLTDLESEVDDAMEDLEDSDDEDYNGEDDEGLDMDDEDEDEWFADRTWRHRPWGRSWSRDDFDWHSDTEAFVGETNFRWPIPETALYRPIPALRYNRVEGFVLGIGSRPMNWDDEGRAKIVGQGGYAFSLEEWRYQIGGEVRLDPGHSETMGTKIGGFYHRNTMTNDLWKSSWVENGLAAFFFEYDFFDYYEVQGYQLYAVQRLHPMVQISAGYRNEDYRSLARNAHWSLFGGNTFSDNLQIDSLDHQQSLVFAAEGGTVTALHTLPQGVAFRAEVELAEPFGNPMKFNRYVGDARGYLRVSNDLGFAARVRAGTATGTVPIQKMFTLGGVGSVRGYAQNAFLGTKMFLLNTEAIFEGIDFVDGGFDDVTLLGFFDAGWVNGFQDRAFDLDDVMPTAGVGLGFNDRTVRLELAFPLRDVGTGMEPSLWIRIAPSF